MATRERLDSLDAMRGVAALVVFAGHAFAFTAPLVPRHSELSVDFFFALSGFVLARAYGDKLGTSMTFGRFVAMRYVRLFPLYLLGILIAIGSEGLAMMSGHGDLSVRGFVVATVTALLLLPSPTWNETDRIMPLNAPAWSLFFELVANFVFAGIYRLLSTRTVVIIVLLSLVGVGLTIARYENFEQGFFWSTFPGGFPRVFFSFFLGVLLFRILPDRQIESHLPWLFLAALVAFQFVPVTRAWLVPFDLAFIMILSPLLIAAGAMVQPRSRRLFQMLGDISYPLYVIHLPIVGVAWRACHVVLHKEPQDFAPWGGIALAGVLAAACLVLDLYYDRPVRRWLMRLIGGKRSSAQPERAPHAPPAEELSRVY